MKLRWRLPGALRHRNYRLFFAGQGISGVGTWMQMTAVGWLVYRLTGSEAILGVVGFAQQIMTFLLSPVAGGFACIVAALVFATRLSCLRAAVEPRYSRLGILRPDVMGPGEWQF